MNHLTGELKLTDKHVLLIHEINQYEHTEYVAPIMFASSSYLCAISSDESE